MGLGFWGSSEAFSWHRLTHGDIKRCQTEMQWRPFEEDLKLSREICYTLGDEEEAPTCVRGRGCSEPHCRAVSLTVMCV